MASLSRSDNLFSKMSPKRFLRWVYYRLPPERRTRLRCRGYWKLAARKLVAPFLQYPVVLTSPEGIRLRLSADPIDERVVQSFLKWHHDFYFPEVSVPLPAEPLILDLGAHNGFYTLWALNNYPNSKIICVEPMPDSIANIRANLALNGWSDRARVVRAALAESFGSTKLKISDEGSWGNSLYETSAKTINSIEVSTFTLTEILNGEAPHIVKCNAEGAEFEFVKQLRRSAWRPLILSIAVHDYFGDTQGLLTDMHRLGYFIRPTGYKHRPVFHFWYQTTRITQKVSQTAI